MRASHCTQFAAWHHLSPVPEPCAAVLTVVATAQVLLAAASLELATSRWGQSRDEGRGGVGVRRQQACRHVQVTLVEHRRPHEGSTGNG